MGCCPSKEDKEQEHKDGAKVITVSKVKLPAGATTSEPQSTGSQTFKDNASQDRPEGTFVPSPPLGQKPSSGFFRRRSGVRLRAALSSDNLPLSSPLGNRIPRPPTVQRTLSLPIRRSSGVRITSSNSSSSETEEKCHTTTPEVIDAPLSRLSGKEVLFQPAEASQDALDKTASTTDLEIQETASILVAQVIKASLAEETDVMRHIESQMKVSEEVDNRDRSSPSTASVTAEKPLKSIKDSSLSKNELAIQKVASFLAAQAIRESLAEETALLLAKESAIQVSEAVQNKDVDLNELPAGEPVPTMPQAGEEVSSEVKNKIIPLDSDKNLTENKEPSSSLTTKVGPEIQEKESAELDVQGTEISAEIHAVKQEDVTVKPFVKLDLNAKENEKQESHEELLVRGTAISIPKVDKPSTTRSLKDVKSTTSVGKGSSKESLGSTPSQPRAKKGIVGKARSLGTVSGAERNNGKRSTKVSRSVSISTSVVAKKSSHSKAEIARKQLTPGRGDSRQKLRVEGAFTIVKAEQPKKSPQASKDNISKSFSNTTQTDIAHKTSTPLRRASKQKVSEKAFTIVKSEQPKKSLELQTRTRKKEITSKSFSNTTQTSKQKNLNLNKRKAAASSQDILKKEEPSEHNFIKQEKTSADQPKPLQLEETETVSVKSFVSMDSDIRLTKAIFEVFNSDKKETTVEGFTVFTDGILKKNLKETEQRIPSPPKSRNTSASTERISVDRVPTSNPIRIRSGSSRRSTSPGGRTSSKSSYNSSNVAEQSNS